MIKGLFRIVAFLLVAAGFVAAIMDAARSLANSMLDYVHVSTMIARVLGDRFNQIQPVIERNIHPMLWDPVLVTILLLPTSVVLLMLGLLFYRLGRRSGRTIGYIARN